MSLDWYQVRSITWRDGEDDKESFEAHDDEDAADEWCRAAARNGNFVDGYPDDHELEVTAPDGVVTVVEVSTDWEPQYYCHSRGPR